MKPLLSIASLLLLVSAGFAGDWPAWRGPTGQGRSDETNLPRTWSSSKNVKWKVPLSEPGNSTPIVSKDKIFLTQANKGGSVRSLLCLSRTDGSMQWKKDVTYAEKERNWNPSWYGNASPVTDGERVIVSFGSAGMFCYDFAGKELWKRTDLGAWDHAFGNSASPVLHGEHVILWCGPNEKMGRNFLLCAKKATGETVWEHDEKSGSWGTPIIAKVGGKDQILLSTSPALKAIDPANGKELWFCEGLSIYVYTSPLTNGDIAVAMSGYNGPALAVKLGGSGDITKDRLWHHPKNTQRVGSGVIVGEHVYIVEENGMPHCYELKTGKEVWQVKSRPAGEKTWGSMVHADGRLYVMMHNGETVVLAANPKYEVLAVNPLGEDTHSTPIVSNGEIFLRTFKHLWCIAEKQ
ncbi:MAG: PQQ-like beta-propeller repeat protein [Gemmataceae bacterium]|nr:PQQ-like beta-propeller repeat protein [Gemmataceae bacterium]